MHNQDSATTDTQKVDDTSPDNPEHPVANAWMAATELLGAILDEAGDDDVPVDVLWALHLRFLKEVAWALPKPPKKPRSRVRQSKPVAQKRNRTPALAVVASDGTEKAITITGVTASHAGQVGRQR